MTCIPLLHKCEYAKKKDEVYNINITFRSLGFPRLTIYRPGTFSSLPFNIMLLCVISRHLNQYMAHKRK